MLKKRVVVRETPRNDIYIGNFDPRQSMIHVAGDFRRAGQRIVDKLVMPLDKPKGTQTLATRNHYLYKIPPSTELVRDSDDKEYERRTGLRRTIKDNVKIAFGHTATSSPFRFLEISRRRTELRGLRNWSVPPKEDSLSMQFWHDFVDDYPSAIFRTWDKDGEYRSHVVLPGIDAVDICAPEACEEIERFEDMGEFMRGTLNAMATAVMMAETASERMPREESREPVLIPRAEIVPVSSHDPHC